MRRIVITIDVPDGYFDPGETNTSIALGIQKGDLSVDEFRDWDDIPIDVKVTDIPDE